MRGSAWEGLSSAALAACGALVAVVVVRSAGVVVSLVAVWVLATALAVGCVLARARRDGRAPSAWLLVGREERRVARGAAPWRYGRRRHDRRRRG